MKILFISLGCDKNLADSEEMLGLLTAGGHEITDDETQADAIVINTCCFIKDAHNPRNKAGKKGICSLIFRNHLCFRIFLTYLLHNLFS